MNNFCKTCLKKQSCKKICKELEEYLKKDIDVYQQEALRGDFPEDVSFPDWLSNIYLTKKEKQILTLLGRGLSRSDICQVLNITRLTLRVHLINLKKKSQNS